MWERGAGSVLKDHFRGVKARIYELCIVCFHYRMMDWRISHVMQEFAACDLSKVQQNFSVIILSSSVSLLFCDLRRKVFVSDFRQHKYIQRGPGFPPQLEKVVFGASFPRKNYMLLITDRCFSSRIDLLVHHCSHKIRVLKWLWSLLPRFGLQLWFYRNQLVSGYSAAQTRNRVFMDDCSQPRLQCFLAALRMCSQKTGEYCLFAVFFPFFLGSLRLLSSCIMC